jgi:hypothetical protein
MDRPCPICDGVPQDRGCAAWGAGWAELCGRPWLGKDAYRTVPAAPAPRPSPPQRIGSSAARVLEAQLRGIYRTLAHAQPGERNNVLYWCACRIGRLAAEGRLDRGEAERYLLAAAQQAAVHRGEAIATIKSGMKGGK